jgi:hypothetical protein
MCQTNATIKEAMESNGRLYPSSSTVKVVP